MAEIDPEVQRSLGRIEGTLTQLLSEVKGFHGALGGHVADDHATAEAFRGLISDLRREIANQFLEQDRARNQHLNEQDVKLDALKADSDRAKGAGWVILGVLGALATFVGGAVIAVLTGLLKLHT